MNRLCDGRWSDEAPTASVLQMTQGSTWDRVLPAPGTSKDLSKHLFLPFFCDRWKKCVDGG